MAIRASVGAWVSLHRPRRPSNGSRRRTEHSRARIQCFQELAADFPGDRNARAALRGATGRRGLGDFSLRVSAGQGKYVLIKPGDREAAVGTLRFRPHDRSIAPNLSIVHDLFWIAPKPGQRIRRRSTSRLWRQRPDDPGSAPPRPWSTSRSVPPHPSPQSPSRPGAEQAPARNGDEAGRRRPAREPCTTASGNGEFGFGSHTSWYSGYPAVLPNEM